MILKHVDDSDIYFEHVKEVDKKVEHDEDINMIMQRVDVMDKSNELQEKIMRNLNEF